MASTSSSDLINLVHNFNENSSEKKYQLTRTQLSHSKVFMDQLDLKEGVSELCVLEYVNPDSLELIVEWLVHHDGKAVKLPEVPLKSSNISDAWEDPWDTEFINRVFQEGNPKRMFDLYSSANYLDINPLARLCATKCACVIKSKKSIEEIAVALGVQSNNTESKSACALGPSAPQSENSS